MEIIISEQAIVERLNLDRKKIQFKGTISIERKQYGLEKIYDLAIDNYMGARFTLAKYYFEGTYNVPQDQGFAINIAEHACNEFHDLPLIYNFQLGTFYQAFKKYDLAIEIFTTLKVKGFAPAISRLAFMHRHGLGIQENLTESKLLLEEAAKLGHVRSQNLLFLHQIKFGALNEKVFAVGKYLLNVPNTIYVSAFKTYDCSQAA